MKTRTLIALMDASVLALTGCSASETQTEQLTSGVDEAAKAAVPQEIRDAGVINVAVDYPYPPFEYQDDAGEITGLDIDLAYAIGEKLDIPVQINKQPFDSVVASLQANKNDIILSGMNDTLERQEVLDFVEYLHAGFAIAVPAGNPEGISDELDLCGLTISSQKASTSGDILRDLSEECTSAGKAEIQIHELATTNDGQTAVQAGNADAFIGDAPIMEYLVATAGDGSTFELVDFADAPKGFEPVYTGVGVLKDEGLTEALTLAMQSIEADGTYDALLEKHDLKQYRVESIDVNLAEK